MMNKAKLENNVALTGFTIDSINKKRLIEAMQSV